MGKKIYHAADDPQFQKPYEDVDQLQSHKMPDGSEIQYRYIHGGFEGTAVRFSFHFPLKEAYEGRFYQHLSPFPGPAEEIASIGKTGEEDIIGFSINHGACFVESNMGSRAVFGTNTDNSIYYRSSAAVAEYCRTAAKRLFGEHKMYGYVFGGSGGGYKTMSCIENTDAWDGALPFVIGSPVSLPTCLTVNVHGMRLLRHAYLKIVDALEPGGNGDMYAGLNDEERDALREITQMGIPPRTCYTYSSGDDGSLPVLAPVVHAMDPEYFKDFWTKPGYLGTEENSSALRDRISMKTRVVSVGILPLEQERAEVLEIEGRNGVDNAWQKMLADGSRAYLELEDVPSGGDLYLCGVNLELISGKAAGRKMLLGSLDGNKAILGMCYGMSDLNLVLGEIKPGDEILIDNSDYIAIQTYHRHQIPEDESFTVWNQYKDEDGKPIYPQRDGILSYSLAGSSGSLQDGQIQGKVMVMNNLMDGDFPWQADWYRKKVEAVHGGEAGSSFRIYYNDNCPHGDQEDTTDELRVTRYLGMLHQALLDLSQWVEKGILPPDNSGYLLLDGQIILEKDIKKRNGYQPDIKVLANGETCVRVSVDETVNFEAIVQTPANGGICTQVEWSFEGENDFPVKSEEIILQKNCGGEAFHAKSQHVFTKPGIYFAVARVTANRNPEDFFTRLRNLGRVRVIVNKES